jgi:hypothetical protein
MDTLSRRLRLRDTFETEMRVEATNVSNRNNYVVGINIYGEGPNPLQTSASSRIAGITDTDPGRQFRFGLRLLF